MPELPEVETLRRELATAVKGQTIKSAQVRWAKLVQPLAAAAFSKKLAGNKILGVERRAKMLLLKLSRCDGKTHDCFLAVHLKMTGQLVYQKNTKTKKQKDNLIFGGHPQKGGTDDLPNKYTHIIINFTDGSTLYFNDLRKFGWMKILDEATVKKLSADYGIEALAPKFNLKKFQELAAKYPNRKIKQLLMDQKLIAGIGNIYADESCFCAGILPSRPVKKINPREAAKLIVCIKKILRLAIIKKGTSIDTYVQLTGQSGGFVPYLKVYGRGGQLCKKCRGKISKTKLNGRGTHFCPHCQK